MIKVLASCGAGIGSSMIIKNNIKKVFDKLEVPVSITHESIGIAKTTASQYDLIFTLKSLAFHFDGVPSEKIIGIKNIMDLNEIEVAVVEFLDRLHNV